VAVRDAGIGTSPSIPSFSILNNVIRVGYLEDTAGTNDALPLHSRHMIRVELPLAAAWHPAPGEEAMTATTALLPGSSCVSAGYVRMAYKALAYDVFYLLVRDATPGILLWCHISNHIFVFITCCIFLLIYTYSFYPHMVIHEKKMYRVSSIPMSASRIGA
jgi:hypothetical protein